jgi:uncharacterized protein YbbC (DUF1343 family)
MTKTRKKSYRKYILIIFIIFLRANSIYSSSDVKIKLGIDVLVEHNFSEISGKRVALFTNFSGRDSKGNLTLEILANSKVCTLAMILTPEHGLYGNKSAGEKVENSYYWNIPVISLYGDGKKIPATLSDKFDIIVVDIQDIGVRAYTFVSSLYYLMQSAAELDKEIIILDRPNPLGGVSVDGNVLNLNLRSFIGLIPVPYLPGLTIGELALMMKDEDWANENKVKNYEIKLKIIKMEGWQRWMQWEDTGLNWVPTSPNIPSVDAVRGAAMLGWIGELGLFSVGIGTNLPFQYFGTPDFDNDFFATFENLEFNGVKLLQTEFVPVYGKYANLLCKGFLLRFEKTNDFTPFTNGIELLLKLRSIYPQYFNPEKIEQSKKQMFNKATGNEHIFELLFNKGSKEEIMRETTNGLIEFLKLRKNYLLY